MATYTSSSGTASFLPDDTGDLVVVPALAASVFASVATVVRTNSHVYRLPIVLADPVAGWFNEGQEITPTDPTLSELLCTPSKLAALSIVSSEMADDSDPAIASVIGAGIARDIARKLDTAAFTTVAAPAQQGLSTVSGVQTHISATAFGNTDGVANAKSKLSIVGCTMTHFIVGPATALTLDTVKTASGSNEPLLGRDATNPTSRSILGVPVVVAPDLATNIGYAVDSSKIYLVVRNDAELTADRSVFFTSDRVAVRGTMRAGFAFPMPSAIVKVTVA